MVTTSEDVGTLLKSHREMRGKDVEDIAREICVRAQYLEAIETSYYEDTPAMVYLLGYIRKYAEYLGLDAQDIVDQFKTERRSYHHLQEAVIVQPIQEDFQPKLLYLIGAMLFLVVVGSGWYVLQRHQHYFDGLLPIPKHIMASVGKGLDHVKDDLYKFTQELHARRQAAKESLHASTKTTEPEEAVSKVETPAAAVDNMAAAPASTEPRSRLVLFAKGKTWVKILDKHNQLIDQAMLQDGDTYFAPDDRSIRVLAENPALIEVYAEESTTP